MRRRDPDAVVYSSQHGRLCPTCGKPLAHCGCRAQTGATTRSGDGVARVRREVKGRRGKTVTTISGLPLDSADLRALAALLKRRCGCGGSVVDGVIEIQGDHCEVLMQELAERGFRAKRAGG